MRVLLTTDYYAPFVGGAERQAGLLAHELNRRGHDCEVVTLRGHGLPDVEEEDDGVRVNRIRQVRTCAPRFVREPKQHATPFPDPIMAMSIRRAVRRFRPDVVHTYGWI